MTPEQLIGVFGWMAGVCSVLWTLRSVMVSYEYPPGVADRRLGMLRYTLSERLGVVRAIVLVVFVPVSVGLFMYVLAVGIAEVLVYNPG